MKICNFHTCKITKISHYLKTAPGKIVDKCQKNSSSVTVMKIKIENIGFRIRFFNNSGRISNINHKLKIEVFTLSRMKVCEKIIFLMNRFDTVNKLQII